MSQHRGPLSYSLPMLPFNPGVFGWLFSWLFFTPIGSPKGMKHQKVTQAGGTLWQICWAKWWEARGWTQPPASWAGGSAPPSKPSEPSLTKSASSTVTH